MLESLGAPVKLPTFGGTPEWKAGRDVALSTDYEIRRLGADDLGVMRGMLRCFGEAFDDAATYLGEPPDDAYLGELLGDPTFVALAAISEGEVVGGLVAYELRKFERRRSEFYIYDLAVLEARRRCGIATALIEALKPVARSRAGWVIFVQVDAVDAPAVALYDKLGVREDGVFHFDIPVD
jgi:aminoglycoside 3-N-acetyltransferase I